MQSLRLGSSRCTGTSLRKKKTNLFLINACQVTSTFGCQWSLVNHARYRPCTLPAFIFFRLPLPHCYMSPFFLGKTFSHVLPCAYVTVSSCNYRPDWHHPGVLQSAFAVDPNESGGWWLLRLRPIRAVCTSSVGISLPSVSLRVIHIGAILPFCTSGEYDSARPSHSG